MEAMLRVQNEPWLLPDQADERPSSANGREPKRKS
jgi:hypothetical protein